MHTAVRLTGSRVTVHISCLSISVQCCDVVSYVREGQPLLNCLLAADEGRTIT